MYPGAKYSMLFLAGFVVQPASIFFHELRHYAAAYCLGYTPTVHFALTTWPGSEHMLKTSAVLAIGAAPLGDAVLTGIWWLYLLRRHRPEKPPTASDWIATLLAAQAWRWMRGFSVFSSNPQPGDEIVPISDSGHGLVGAPLNPRIGVLDSTPRDCSTAPAGRATPPIYLSAHGSLRWRGRLAQSPAASLAPLKVATHE